MQELDIASALHGCLMVALKMSAPPLLAALVVGLLVSLLQAVTQINEATLAFVPKVVVIGITLALLGHFMAASLLDYTRAMFDRLVAVGGG